MIINKSGEYAIRCMIVLSEAYRNSLLSSEDIHKTTNIPKEYLSKILKKLTNEKLLISEKGHHGGYKLALNPSKINILDILNATGNTINSKHCFFGWDKCDPKKPCPLHDCFSKMKENVLHWAKSNNLNSISKSKKA